MNRFSTNIFGLAVSIALSVSASAEVVAVPQSIVSEEIAGAKPRNVVFILSDDHRYDAMSFMGHAIAKTPHMDAMASSGVHLKNAFVTTSLCSPSRASILTGLYTFRHRVIDNQRPIPEGTLFFPQYLQQAGYHTGFIGKWHMGHANDDPRPGFDYWFSFKGQGNYYPPNDKYTINDNGKRVPQDGYITTLLTRRAIDFLEQQTDQDKPFFLYLSHKAVHGPFTPEPKYKGTLAKSPFELPASNEKTTFTPKVHHPNVGRFPDAVTRQKAAGEPEKLVVCETDGDYPHNGVGGLAIDPANPEWLSFGFGENLGADYTFVGSGGVKLFGGAGTC